MFIKGIENETHVLNGVDPHGMDVALLKMLVADALGIPADEQRLLFAGRQLDEDEALLADYGICADSTVHLSLSLLGGGKKRKKKQYTGPKKQKHVHKKVKLAVLKLYKVDDNTEKIQRLRIECASATCGAGIFMAKHKDRHYCGKCHSTMTEKK